MIERAPAPNALVVNVAVPLLKVALESVVPPTFNVTVPLAVLGATVAVNVTLLP